MEDQDADDKNKLDDNSRILYNTFLIIGIIVFIWLLMILFTDDKIEKKEQSILDNIKDQDN